MSHASFITLEGGEGSGKTTQGRLLKAAFDAAGTPCLLTREPGGEPGAEEVRALLVQGEAGRWEPEAETLLFLAARVQHARRVILPALARGTWVVCDRFFDSTRVYQGIGKGLSIPWCDRLHALVLGNLAPRLTLLLDALPEIGLARSLQGAHAESRFERMDISFHEAVRAGFLDLAAHEPERMAVLDAAQPSDAVHHAILAAVNARFGLALAHAHGGR